MAQKKSRMYSIMKGKCPVCHEGDVWKSKALYNIKKYDKMHERCPSCDHKFEKEPGFFYGAMYVAYAISIAFSVAISVLTLIFVPSTPYWMYIILIFLVLVGLAPITFRVSRMIWMNMFAKFKPKKQNG